MNLCCVIRLKHIQFTGHKTKITPEIVVLAHGLYYITFKPLTSNLFVNFREYVLKIALIRNIFQPKMHQIAFKRRERGGRRRGRGREGRKGTAPSLWILDTPLGAGVRRSRNLTKRQHHTAVRFPVDLKTV